MADDLPLRDYHVPPVRLAAPRRARVEQMAFAGPLPIYLCAHCTLPTLGTGPGVLCVSIPGLRARISDLGLCEALVDLL